MIKNELVQICKMRNIQNQIKQNWKLIFSFPAGQEI
jgi:hypothetical protein